MKPRPIHHLLYSILKGSRIHSLVMPILLFVCFMPSALAGNQDWKSGQGSPVHDSDRLYPLGQKRVSLENDCVLLEFDQSTGALTHFENKRTHWSITPRAELAESFVMFVPLPGRDYDPVLGARNPVSSMSKSPDGKQLTLVWDNLQSEYAGKLDIRFEATVTLKGSQVSFNARIVNHSNYTVSSIEWPILGDLQPPTRNSSLTREIASYGNLNRDQMWPTMGNEGGGGANYPTQIANNGGYGIVRYVLIAAPGQGLYLGTHDTTGRELVSYTTELKPGYGNSYMEQLPQGPMIDGHPARLVLGAVHFPFLNPSESGDLETVVLNPYKGDWHNGVDIYKKWKATWFKQLPMPSWINEVNSWQQIQINSSEDDFRTTYSDLPRRAEQAAKNGVAAIQLVGWNDGGQDRNNPSQDTDPRLGTPQDLKDAIANIQKNGVHVILFNKYIWADITTDWYKRELHNYMATDPYGIPYQFGGYEYETPEQLNKINKRRLAPACLNDQKWLDISANEFQKILDLGADGMLYDEVFHHGGAFYCFSKTHGHHSPESLWSGDLRLANRFSAMVQKSGKQGRFLFAGEDPYDLETQTYALSYFRISPGDIPAERYAAPFQPMMIAADGFNDREMINHALMDRYIISYESFNFKGNLSDFPLTLNYGKKVDALRRKYKKYLWDAEFRDTLEASVTQDGKPYPHYSVFRTSSGKHAVVLINDGQYPVHVRVKADGAQNYVSASPESPIEQPATGSVSIPARSAVVLMQQ